MRAEGLKEHLTVNYVFGYEAQQVHYYNNGKPPNLAAGLALAYDCATCAILALFRQSKHPNTHVCIVGCSFRPLALMSS